MTSQGVGKCREGPYEHPLLGQEENVQHPGDRPGVLVKKTPHDQEPIPVRRSRAERGDGM